MSKHSQDVVRMLYENQPNYISGQFIADQLNISRAGVKNYRSIKTMVVTSNPSIIKVISSMHSPINGTVALFNPS